MVPQNDSALNGIEIADEPTYTYKMNMESNRIIGKCDGVAAMKQAIFKILNTERYECPLYPWDYGVELKELFGKPKTYCVPEIERRIREALLYDSRISKVYNFSFEHEKNVIHVSFSVDTNYGTISEKKEIMV